MLEPKINILQRAKYITEPWKNIILTNVNDHVVRLSVMDCDFRWHSHSNSDELFYVLSGSLFIETEHGTIELNESELYMIPKGMKHKTYTKQRAVLLCFEHSETNINGS